MKKKRLGVILIDIGGGTTDIAVWKERKTHPHSQIIPTGGNHFTNDLAVALKIPHNEAEKNKNKSWKCSSGTIKSIGTYNRSRFIGLQT